MIPRSSLEEHLSDFAKCPTVEQSEHLKHAHSHDFVDVFAGERRLAHSQAHRAHPHPEQSHTRL